METTQKLGLQIVPETQEATTKVRDYRRSTSANFTKIDAAVGELQTQIQSVKDYVDELNDKRIHVCPAAETTTLGDGTIVPKIETPDAGTVYLVSSGDAAPNMYLEYIWVNGAWELWGSASVDLTGYATEDWANDRFVTTNQGTTNAGKHLVVGSDGNIDFEASSYWHGKRAMFFGTSITYHCMAGNTYATDGYPQLIASALNLNFSTSRDVYGMSGRAMADSANGNGIYSGIASKNTSGADLVCIECATNDFKLNVPMGSIGQIGDSDFDTSTFCGALRSAIETIIMNNPYTQILLITDTQRNNDGYDTNYVNSAGYRMEDYVMTMIRVGNMYGIPVCDWYHKSGLNMFNIGMYTTDPYTGEPDGLHLNSLGYQRVADLTIETLLSHGADTPILMPESSNT